MSIDDIHVNSILKVGKVVMKASFAKNVYNHLPEGVKKVTGSFIRKKLIENPLFIQQYNELVDTDSLSEEQKKTKQFDLLKTTCIHAYEHTKYYKALFDRVGFDPYSFSSFEDFSNMVPTISKEDVIANFDGLNSDDISDDYPATTGGSSGTRLQVNNAWEAFYKENAFHFHFMSKYGYDYKKHKILLLAGEESDTLCSISPLYNMIRVSGRHLNQSNFPEALQFVNKEKPDFVIALPSAAYQFCKYLMLSGEKIQSKIQYVFFRSENINPQQRKFVETILGCGTAAYYGSTERIAWGEEFENKDGIPIYTFNPLYGYVEIDREDGISLVSTGFINPKMPLIRYKTDDIITFVRKDRYHVEGHRTAVMIGKNGESISPEFFCHLENTFDIIEKYQFEQYEKGKAIVKIVPRKDLPDKEIKEIEDMFANMAAYRIIFEAKIVDHVELTSRGKFKLLYKSIEG